MKRLSFAAILFLLSAWMALPAIAAEDLRESDPYTGAEFTPENHNPYFCETVEDCNGCCTQTYNAQMQMCAMTPGRTCEDWAWENLQECLWSCPTDGPQLP